MASYIWSGPNGGNWSDPANWTPNGIPSAADSALVNLAGSYTIALDVTTIGSLTLDAPGVTITPSIAFTLAGVLDVQSGTFVVNSTITGGTLKPDGGTIDYAGGTLDGVTLSGPLDLSASSGGVSIKDGIGFTGPAPGQIIDTGGGPLSFQDAETLSNVAITLGGPDVFSIYGVIVPVSSLNAGPALTLAADTTIAVEGVADIDGSLDNRGRITVTAGDFNDYAKTVNDGFISVSDGNGYNVYGGNSINSLTSNTGTISVSGAHTLLAVGDAVNAGIFTVTGGATLVTNNTFDNTSGMITLDAGSTLDLESTEADSQLGTIARNGGSITIGGILDNTGQILDITAGSVFDGAQLTGIVEGGTVELDGGTLGYGLSASGTGTTGTFDGVTLVGSIDLGTANAHLSIEDGIVFAGTAPEQILVTGSNASLEFLDNETLNNVAIAFGNNSERSSLLISDKLTLATSSTLTVTGNTYVSGDSMDNKGSITVTAGYFEDLTDITNEGSIVISGGSDDNYLGYLTSNTGTISVSGAGTALNFTEAANAGLISVANAATVNATEATFTNTGAITLSSGATLNLGQDAADAGTVSFLDDAGTLNFKDFGPFGAILSGFSAGDVVSVRDDGYSLNHSGNTLTLSVDGNTYASFTLTGQDYSNDSFTLTSLANGTGDITTDAPCFCAGTLILTDRGERAIESLEVGDLVVIRREDVETLMPVRWLGRRRVIVARHPEPEHVDPVRIMRDAVAPGVPVRDLFVSPDHALFLDGMLIQARQLVNHMTITRDRGRATVTYHHVELDRHAVLIADGMPCESYLDGGNRRQFDRQGIVVPLHPPVVGTVQPCAPLITDAIIVEPIWQRLAERARLAGYAQPMPRFAPDLAPWVETADGERLLLCGDGLRFALPPSCIRVRLCSASDRPTTLSPWSDDRRRLGVAVGAVVLHRDTWRQPLPLEGLDATAGWWPLETAGDLAWRWSDGDGWIDLPEPAQSIEITLHAIMRVSAAGERQINAATG